MDNGAAGISWASSGQSSIPKRWAHSCTSTDAGSAIVFGGFAGAYLNDCWVVSSLSDAQQLRRSDEYIKDSGHWKALEADDNFYPCVRSNHAAVELRGRVLIHGGGTKKERFDDAFLLQLVTDGGSRRVASCAVKAAGPMAMGKLSFHAGAEVGTDNMPVVALFGGADERNEDSSSVYLLRFSSAPDLTASFAGPGRPVAQAQQQMVHVSLIRRHGPEGSWPQARRCHSMSRHASSGAVIVHGGACSDKFLPLAPDEELWFLRASIVGLGAGIETTKWTRPARVTGTAPEQRWGHALVSVPGSDHFIVVGGNIPSTVPANAVDTAQVDILTIEGHGASAAGAGGWAVRWSRVAVTGLPLTPRRRLGAALVWAQASAVDGGARPKHITTGPAGASLLVFGGYSSEGYHGDVCVMSAQSSGKDGVTAGAAVGAGGGVRALDLVSLCDTVSGVATRAATAATSAAVATAAGAAASSASGRVSPELISIRAATSPAAAAVAASSAAATTGTASASAGTVAAAVTLATITESSVSSAGAAAAAADGSDDEDNTPTKTSKWLDTLAKASAGAGFGPGGLKDFSSQQSLKEFVPGGSAAAGGAAAGGPALAATSREFVAMGPGAAGPRPLVTSGPMVVGQPVMLPVGGMSQYFMPMPAPGHLVPVGMPISVVAPGPFSSGLSGMGVMQPMPGQPPLPPMGMRQPVAIQGVPGIVMGHPAGRPITVVGQSSPSAGQPHHAITMTPKTTALMQEMENMGFQRQTVAKALIDMYLESHPDARPTVPVQTGPGGATVMAVAPPSEWTDDIDSTYLMEVLLSTGASREAASGAGTPNAAASASGGSASAAGPTIAVRGHAASATTAASAAALASALASAQASTGRPAVDVHGFSAAGGSGGSAIVDPANTPEGRLAIESAVASAVAAESATHRRDLETTKREVAAMRADRDAQAREVKRLCLELKALQMAEAEARAAAATTARERDRLQAEAGAGAGSGSAGSASAFAAHRDFRAQIECIKQAIVEREAWHKRRVEKLKIKCQEKVESLAVCSLCLERPRAVFTLPCSHMASCVDCFQRQGWTVMQLGGGSSMPSTPKTPLGGPGPAGAGAAGGAKAGTGKTPTCPLCNASVNIAYKVNLITDDSVNMRDLDVVAAELPPLIAGLDEPRPQAVMAAGAGARPAGGALGPAAGGVAMPGFPGVIRPTGAVAGPTAILGRR